MIVVLCGPPGAGKTTVGKVLQRRLDARGYSFGLLDSDEFARNTYDRMYDRVADSDDDWIVAGTFYRRAWQDRFQGLEDVCLVYLDAPLETCLERNRRRPAPIDEQAVHIIWREFDDPDADLVVDVTERSPGDVADRILSVLDRRLGTAG